jgi:thermostable 8-oxoguanine DNA glycosylase
MTAAQLLDPGPMVALEPPAYPKRWVRWGHPWQVGTPAFWVGLTGSTKLDEDGLGADDRHRLGRTLIEEVAVCLLGGHGMPHQMGLAAFETVRDARLLDRASTACEIESALRLPMNVGDRAVKYRFPAQKAAFLAAALEQLHASDPPMGAPELRDWLLQLPGIGPKTSGWIVRNFLGSDEVAIIDIHVFRAGADAGVFDPGWTPARDYGQLEALFLCWAELGGVRAADLDAVIWSERARMPRAYARSAS